MPVPVSAISMATRPGAAIARPTVTRPPRGVNLTAFCTRLPTTWRSRAGSARTQVSSPATLASAMPRAAASPAHVSTASSSTRSTPTVSGRRSSFPDATRVTSSRSSMSRASSSALRRIVSNPRRAGFGQRAVPLQAGAQREHGREGRAQLVGQRREEPVLGAVRFLGLVARAAQLLLRRLQVVDVGGGAEPGLDRPVLAAHRHDPGEHPAIPRAGAEPEFQAVRPSLRDRGLADAPDFAQVVGMGEANPARSERAVPRTNHVLPAAVQVDDVAARVAHPHELLDGVGHGAIARLAFADLRFYPEPLALRAAPLGGHGAEDEERRRGRGHRALQPHEAELHGVAGERAVAVDRGPRGDRRGEEVRARRAADVEPHRRPDRGTARSPPRAARGSGRTGRAWRARAAGPARRTPAAADAERDRFSPRSVRRSGVMTRMAIASPSHQALQVSASRAGARRCRRAGGSRRRRWR